MSVAQTKITCGLIYVRLLELILHWNINYIHYWLQQLPPHNRPPTHPSMLTVGNKQRFFMLFSLSMLRSDLRAVVKRIIGLQMIPLSDSQSYLCSSRRRWKTRRKIQRATSSIEIYGALSPWLHVMPAYLPVLQPACWRRRLPLSKGRFSLIFHVLIYVTPNLIYRAR